MNLLQFALHEMLLAQVLILIFVNVHLCCDPFSYRRNLQLKFYDVTYVVVFHF